MDKKHKILIIDDEKDPIDLLTQWFPGDKFDVLSAPDGNNGLQTVEKEHPDIILLDIMMPGMDGFEVAEKLKKSRSYKSIPIIMLTAKHDSQSKVKGFEIGVDDYVTKPFDFDEVDARIKAMIKKRALYLELERKNIQLEKTNTKLKDMTITDEKTSLYNFRYFKRKLQEEFKRAKRYETPLSLIMVDLDDFKEINDCLGHQKGDKVLQELAELLHSTARETDFTARYGGEEFSIILPNTDSDMAMQVAERLRQAVSTHRYLKEEKPTTMTISAGISTFPDELGEIRNDHDLIKTADAALYKAKSLGKNRINIHGGPILKVALDKSAEDLEKRKEI